MSSACLRGIGGPLALMIRPRSSLPQSPYRVRYDADSATGFRAYPLVHITPWSPSIRDRALAKFLSRQPLLQAATGRSTYSPPRVISAKTMRATLLANATAVSLNLYAAGLRAINWSAQTRRASL